MPQKLAYSVLEKWPTEPELVVREGEAVLRIPPPPRWANFLQVLLLGGKLVICITPMLLMFWLATKIDILVSAWTLVWLIDGAMFLAAFVIVPIEIWNTARFGSHGAELWTSGGALHYRRVAFLRGIRTSTYDAGQIIELRAEAKQGRRGKTRLSLHIHFLRRFPIQRVMKTSDSSLAAKVESAFRTALGLSHATDTATAQVPNE